jgi:hypothetical protein
MPGSNKNSKSNALNKPAKGGVNYGQTKALANSRAVTAPSNNQKKTVSIGPAGDDNPHKSTRTKERTITDIIEKVSTWRKLYNGVMVPNP